MLNLNSIMIGTKQLKAMATFYENVLGKPADMSDDASGFFGWQVGSTFVGLLDHSEMSGKAKDPGRMMINFETAQVKEEFERVKAIAGLLSENRIKRAGGGLRHWPIQTETTFN